MENIQKFISSLGSADLQSFILVQQAYLEFAFNEEIMDIGMNTSSGYVYIALENGICIASCFGQQVDYIVTDFETGEETFFDTYYESTQSINA